MTPLAPPQPVRLLIAEDDIFTRRSLVSSALSRGFTVIGEATTGPEAVDKTMLLRPEAILMDIEMPGCSGLEAARRIQHHQPTPIVIVTAHDSPGLARSITDTGAGAYLLKPVVPADIEHAVAIAMARHSDLLKLKALVKQKELLVREVYHRVANQMSITANLLHLQAIQSGKPDVRDILLGSESRVRSMAKIHSLLQTAPNQTEIPLTPYLSTLAANLISGLRPDLAFQETHQGMGLVVSSFTAMSCGFLAHELVMNCIRHAFPSGQSGVIKLSTMISDRKTITLAIHDNGTGLPPGFSLSNPSSLGLMIANALTRDLNGTLSASSNKTGTTVTLSFPLPEEQDLS